MKKTVAIVGTHPATRGDFDFNRKDTDIWVFNETLSRDWCKRATAIFQMHKPVIWRSRTNKADPKHYEFLQDKDSPPIYMMKHYDDVPNSIRYPLDEVLKLAPGYGYFTSSVSYAIALAILQKYERIEIYGVEMETNTEYGHQRVGVAFWVGLAIGKGIEVIFHSPSLFKAPLYGYDGNAKIPLSFYEGRIDTLKEIEDEKTKQLEEWQTQVDRLIKSWIRTYKTDLTPLNDLVNALGQGSHNLSAIVTARMVEEDYLKRCRIMLEENNDYLIVRQEYEGNAIYGGRNMQKFNAELNRYAEDLMVKRKKLDTNASHEIRQKLADEFYRTYKKYMEASANTGACVGLIEENRIIIGYYDQLLRANGQEDAPVQEVKEEICEPV